MNAALAGAFTVVADWVLVEVGEKKYAPVKDVSAKSYKGAGELFGLGFSASMLQQIVGPMIFSRL